jgi:hypothetical protein
MMPEHESMATLDENRTAEDGTVGAGTPGTAPGVAPKVSLLEGQPALILGSVVTIATALLASPALPIPAGVKAVLAVIVAVAGVFGIRSRVTPVANPKLDGDTPLTP